GLEQTGVEAGQPGIAKAAGLNQRLFVGFEILIFPIRSGRPPNKRVLEGSNPEKLGVSHSGLEIDDAARFPAANDLVDNRRETRAKALALTERKAVDKVGYRALGRHKIDVTPLSLQ